ncbi:hypothetical protein EDC96DRAFT_255512 [Choanephora cucurbitarum]|nr:hypothetical protein EDC96DRAFT_255512 [Choanephora cucurbitarum]
MTTAAVSFTGGKDCTLALHKVRSQNIQVAVLVTFSPPSTDPKSFKAHSLEIIQQQARALGIEHTVCIIDGPDYLTSYQTQIRLLADRYGINTLVTGDILPVCSDFMERAVQDTGVALMRPLWKQSQSLLLKEMWESNFQMLITCTNSTKISADILARVEHVFEVGKLLTKEGIDAIKHQMDSTSSFSPTGEYGELHTMVLDCPLYKSKRLEIDHEKLLEGDFIYLKINQVRLISK